MKTIKYITALFTLLVVAGCTDIINLDPQSNISQEEFYSDYSQLRIATNGCYKGLQKPLTEEWTLTELRSDNVIQGSPSSTSTPNADLNYLDEFFPSTSHQGIYKYWVNTYNNIRNANLVLNAVGANYSITTNNIEFEPIQIPVTDFDAKRFSAEASFIRAYHYFNLVRLYGGVFLVHEPITPEVAKTMNRVSIDAIYKLIEADLKNTIANGNTTIYTANSPDLGLVNTWAAKALLAKVYLTLNRKAEASVLLQSIITSSGYGLETSYANVFSVFNEMNKEILFAVRYKGGGLGMGNPLSNLFAPSNSGNAIINGDGKGYNTPSKDLYSNSYGATDLRKNINIGLYGTSTYYPKKFMSVTAIANDAENDWPVLRYSDVLLMKAEADGNTAASLALINLVHVRAGLVALTSAAVTTPLLFEKALANERRWEFAFENQRWFDLLRFKTTAPTQVPETIMAAHFSYMWASHYSKYPFPQLSLADIQGNANSNRFLLPIPQFEIDTNSFIVIPQNPGY